jgi:hypothetical protein
MGVLEWSGVVGVCISSMYMHGVLWSGVSQDSTECFLGVVEHDSNSTQSALCQSLGFDSGPS